MKNDETAVLKSRAERSGKAYDWAAYAEALEECIKTAHAALLHESGESEATRDSAAAHRIAIEAIEADGRFLTGPVQLLMDCSSEFLYAIEVRGQSSAAAQDKQGLKPLRGLLLERLDETGIPVFFAICDGGKWRTAWMSELGPSVAISRGLDGAKEETARAGWPVSQFRTSDELTLPENYDPEPRGQEKLG